LSTEADQRRAYFERSKLGHQVRLMPAKDVKAYVKRNKNDAADAEAICEAGASAIVRWAGADDFTARVASIQSP
jgi:transposase